MAITENAEGEYWDEDAKRINKLAELAKEKGLTIPVAPKKTPKLKADGSYDKDAK